MGRYQKGYVYEAFGAWHVRYYITELVDGKPVRKQKSSKLCNKDDEHFSAKCAAVQKKLNRKMQEINDLCGNTSEQDVLITDYWTNTYRPFLEISKRPSTLNGYDKIWKQHLESHFAGLKLREYRTHHGVLFLTALVRKGMGLRTIAHVRSLASGLFIHAKQLNYIEHGNPWKDAASQIEAKQPKKTQRYSLEEAKAIFNALRNDLRSLLIFCLATFCGLRPGEIAGLRFEDLDEKWIHIRRSAWCGIVGETKTDESVDNIPLIKPIRAVFAAWRNQCGNPAEGWVFPSRSGDGPLNMYELPRRDIVPVLEKCGLTYRGLYAGRRAAATLLTKLTGNALAASYVLRHKDLATTTKYYVEVDKSSAVDGMLLLEGQLNDLQLNDLEFQPVKQLEAAATSSK